MGGRIRIMLTIIKVIDHIVIFNAKSNFGQHHNNNFNQIRMQLF